jgi:quercetin dioxygenase-like cupin family protein
MNTLPVSRDIFNLVQVIKNNLANGYLYTPEMPTTHHFSDNIYCREIFMPAGSVVVGKKHATRHLNIVLSGECVVWTVHGKKNLKAGMIFESLAGEQKVVLMKTDVRFLTIHYNPDNLREEAELEGKYIRSEEQLPLFPELETRPLLEKELEKLT